LLDVEYFAVVLLGWLCVLVELLVTTLWCLTGTHGLLGLVTQHNSKLVETGTVGVLAKSDAVLDLKLFEEVWWWLVFLETL